MHQIEWFQVWFFKNFLGRGSPSPLPRPLPPFFLGLRPRFGLRPQFSGASRPRLGLRPQYSGASRLRFGLRPQLSIVDLVWPPQSKILDPPLGRPDQNHKRSTTLPLNTVTIEVTRSSDILLHSHHQTFLNRHQDQIRVKYTTKAEKGHIINKQKY